MTKTNRPASTLVKLDRVRKALRFEQPDRVPISDFFWGGFVARWRRELGLPPDADPYRYYDLDWIVTTPNMDPHIRPFETLREDQNEIWVKTGFETVLRKRLDRPMPEQISWVTDTIDKLEVFEFDDPADRRRYFEAGDNQIAGVGDGFQRNSPPWVETVQNLRADFPVFGSMIEPSECLTRMIGQENTLLWMGLYPERMGASINRIGEFYLAACKAAIAAAGGNLDGFVIWGDVAYRRGMFFSPDYWREYFKPWVKAMVAHCHAHGLPVIYHGCGCIKAILGDYIEIGVDALNPLEAKAGMDVLDLRRKYGRKIAFCGNSDIQIWETGDENRIRAEVLRKLNAAKGGGLIFQSDHSVASDVSGRTYDYIVRLVREYGVYPLDLGSFDESIDPIAG
jgi:uroporphyrinogen decarboxylase